ncbi:hypothetical protein PTKIN_Ptkin04bG0005400 [Pterospermum kingtungense]
MSGIGYILGDGKKILFWHHEWIHGVVLKFRFPRLFAMAVNKDATVFKSGIFFDGEWQWNIIFRRRLFNWEVELWNSFWELLGGYSICTTLKDSIV